MSNSKIPDPDLNRQPTYDEFKKRRPAWTTIFRRNLEFYFFRFGLFLGRKLTRRQLQNFGKKFARFAYVVLRKDRGIVEKQLELIYPELDPQTRNQWTRECFGHFGQMLFEFLGLPQWIRDEKEILHVENEEVLTEAFNAGQGVILLTLHSGNWEMITAYAKRTGLPMKAATTNVPDERINQLILQQREQETLEILPRGSSTAIRKLLQCLRNKEILVLAIDQDTNVLSTWVPFFGIPAKTPVGAAVFALKTGAAVLSYTAIRQEDGSFLMRFDRVGNFARKHAEMEQDVYEVTRTLNHHLEKRVREHPKQWAWFHRRWRHRPNPEELEKLKELENRILTEKGSS